MVVLLVHSFHEHSGSLSRERERVIEALIVCVAEDILSPQHTNSLPLCGIMISFMIWTRFWALHLGDDDGFGWLGVLWVAQRLALSPENYSDLKWEIEPLTISQLSRKWGICRHVRERLVLLLHFAWNKNICNFPFQHIIEGWCRSRIWSRMSAKLHVSRLRKELSKRGLDSSGLKPALVCFSKHPVCKNPWCLQFSIFNTIMSFTG